MARFIERFDARRERCWIAAVNGEVVGSVFLVEHAKTVGQLRLWTNSVLLLAARHIYRKAGFRITHKERHRSCGRDLVGETWEPAL